MKTELNAQEKDRLIEILSDLIAAPSPSGEEKEAVMVAKGFFEGSTFRTEIDANGSLIAILDGNVDGKTLLVDGHIDTVIVPSPSLWPYPPFKATVTDGKIYGRGASDMKGSDAAFIAAALRFALVHGHDFAGKLALSLTVEEELFEGVSSRLVSKAVRPDYVIIGESTEGRVNIGGRGRCEIVLETYGKSCHSANPEKGINALTEMMRALEALKSFVPQRDSLLGEGILVPTDIISSPYPGSSVIPEKCTVTFDRRLLAGETEESVIENLSALFSSVQGLSFKVYIRKGMGKCWTGRSFEALRFFPAWKLDPEHELVKGTVNALEAIGQSPVLAHYSFCSNGSHFSGEVGIPTIGYGAGRENLAHTVGEYCPLSSLYETSLGYEAIFEELLT